MVKERLLVSTEFLFAQSHLLVQCSTFSASCGMALKQIYVHLKISVLNTEYSVKHSLLRRIFSFDPKSNSFKLNLYYKIEKNKVKTCHLVFNIPLN